MPEFLTHCRLDRYDTIGAPSARKLSALALCVLLTLPMPALLDRLEVMLPHVTSTWLEVGDCHAYQTDTSPLTLATGAPDPVLNGQP